MKNIKKIMIILVIMIIAISICIVLLNNIDEKENIIDIGNEVDNSKDFIQELSLVSDYSTYFSVEKMLNKYIENIKSNNEEVIYKLLDDSYIKQNNITEKNVLSNIGEVAQYCSKLKIRKIYEQRNQSDEVYYIYAILEKKHQGKEFYFTIYKDATKETFSISHISQQQYEQKIKVNTEELERKQIEKNEYNNIEFINPTEEQIAKKYLESYIEDAIYYTEYTYNLINKEYKNKCFENVEDFKIYIENKKETYLLYDTKNIKQFGEFDSIDEYLIYLDETEQLKLERYQIRKEKDYSRYICEDNYGNSYIFYATSPFNYTVLLDNYTFPTDEFVEKYHKKSDKEKVVLNVKRFIMGLNDKNYGYSYSVLAESFKANKYATKNDFINYAKQNFFEKNKIENISCEKENGLYICKVKIKDETKTSTEEKSFNIIVKLNSGTDFEMSFSKN